MSHRIFIVDDHPLVREMLSGLLNQQTDLQVCGDAETLEMALYRIKEEQPDLVIVDIALPSGSGLDLVKQIKHVAPDCMSLVLSMYDELTYAERAIRAGARGYLSKRDTTKKILLAVREVLAGRIYISADFKSLVTEKFLVQGRATEQGAKLSDRELEVFRLLGEGKETKQIADSLRISVKTVQVYCARIKEKYGLANHTELLRRAMRWVDSQEGGVPGSDG
jgi:DNA-binding NarL/FixJ family response regulator